MRNGFTLLELMIVVAIVSILSAIALPAYQDYVIRARVAEGLALATHAKTLVSEVATVNGLGVVASSWNAQQGGVGSSSKYVDSVQIAATTGVVTVSFNTANVGVSSVNNKLGFYPFVKSAAGYQDFATAINSGLTGPVDWACTSSTNQVATSRSMGAAITANGIETKYAPAECR
ncbi:MULTISPECIES: pilin [Ottowia]|jgi:type IV pilin|uniref:Pilin n=1 Tax=Ottowia cancrivicina TaxID=3040346 RepID=A0AAW6RIR6_9BURK|nr:MULTISPECIES: pilin [unclassified Ottowia]AKU67004.1 hypothetical protein ADJ79_06800 [Ottowia sp. oral taxon 894]MDG9698506.1 pilin [Ottowia sp. 10c7w1]